MLHIKEVGLVLGFSVNAHGWGPLSLVLDKSAAQTCSMLRWSTEMVKMAFSIHADSAA
jgi:hypothetical protein